MLSFSINLTSRRNHLHAIPLTSKLNYKFKEHKNRDQLIGSSHNLFALNFKSIALPFF